MAEEKLKTLRIRVKPVKKDGEPIYQIPIRVYDPIMLTSVELNPDGEVSEEFAKNLCGTYDKYEIIETKTKCDKKDYIIRKDYRKVEFNANFNLLTPDERDLVLEFMYQLQLSDDDKNPNFLKEYLPKVEAFFPKGLKDGKGNQGTGN